MYVFSANSSCVCTRSDFLIQRNSSAISPDCNAKNVPTVPTSKRKILVCSSFLVRARQKSDAISRRLYKVRSAIGKCTTRGCTFMGKKMELNELGRIIAVHRFEIKLTLFLDLLCLHVSLQMLLFHLYHKV